MNVRDQQAENTKNAILKVAAEMFLSKDIRLHQHAK